MSIAKNLNAIRSSMPREVTLVAVSKTKPVSDLMEAYDAGQRHFGENKVQEMVDKKAQMPSDVNWHMIGHLQRNKVKYLADFVTLIHSVDNIKLLKEINKQAEKHHRLIDCLIQIKIASEESKFGMDKDEALDILRSEEFSALSNVKVTGVMGMATFTDNQEQLKEEFQTLLSAFDELKKIKGDNCQLEIVSMGMSGDYQLAIECGSTMVRVGSSIFGDRQYSIQ